ncbi:MAG: ABC transporter permease [Saprospiraceae bacterium]|nr:ABC transporter permease [Saprospiraceae bacterium]
MRNILTIIRKEFSQFFRDKTNIRMLLVMPAIQLIILPLVADYEVKNIKLCVVDHDHSHYVNEMIQKITSSGYINLCAYENSMDKAMHLFEQDEADVILEIMPDFEKNLIRDNEVTIGVSINAVNGPRASIGGQYLQSILGEFNREIRLKWIQFPKFNPVPIIKTEHSYWFNPSMNYKHFMVPGILVILLTMVGANMSALNFVKEKEIGTIEQINVSPIKKYEFILGKLIPFWILGQVVLTIGLIIAFLFYGIIPKGSIALIYVFSSFYLLAVLSFGLLISTYVKTQQQTMLISFFFMMIFILLSGLYTSIDSMPKWGQVVTWFNPIAYFVKVNRMVIMKGSGFSDILPSILSMIAMATVLISWAVFNYKKRA